ncbi:MAG: tetratricopeptide repeat protein [Aureispira sp.]
MTINELKQGLESALQNEVFEELKTRAKEAVSAYPEEAFGYAYLGEALFGELPIPFAEVELCLAKAAELAPTNTHYLARFAVVKGVQGANDAAQLMWGKILSIDPNHVEALVAKGTFLLQNNQDYDKALPFFDKAIEVETNNATAYLYRAELYNNSGRYLDALQDVKQATSITPAFDKNVNLLTISIFKNMGELEQIIPLYEELIEKAEDDYLTHLAYANVLNKLEKASEALVQLEKANELTENKDTTILYNLGETAMRVAEYAKAMQAFQTCLELQPSLNEAAFAIINIQIQQEQYNEALQAIQQLEKIIEEATKVDQLIVLNGKVLIGLGQFKKAEDLLIPIAKKNGLYQTEAYFQLGRLYHQQGAAFNAYKFIKTAATKAHQAAQEFMTNQLADVVARLRAAAIDANKAAFAKNERSDFLNKIFGKLWVFNDLRSERLNGAGFNADQIQHFKASLSSSSLMMAEKGILMLSNRQEELATYKIQKETTNGALIEFLPMDGFKGFTAKLQLTADGALAFSKEKGELILYKEQHPAQVSPAIKAVYQEKINAKDSQYLGDKVTAVLTQIL